MKVVYSELKRVREALEALDYFVFDKVYKRRKLDVRYAKPEHMVERAKNYIDACLEKGIPYNKMVVKGKVPQPTWSYAIKELHRRGMVTDAFMKENERLFSQKAPEITPEQYEQGYDAFYYAHLVPVEQRLPVMQEVLDFYDLAGRTVDLLKPYVPSGNNRGRSSASQKLRNFRNGRAEKYNRVKSRTVKVDEQTNELIAVKPVYRPSKSKYSWNGMVKNANGKMVRASSVIPIVQSSYVPLDPNIVQENEEDEEEEARSKKKRRLLSKEEIMEMNDQDAIDALDSDVDSDLEVFGTYDAETKTMTGKKVALAEARKQLYLEREQAERDLVMKTAEYNELVYIGAPPKKNKKGKKKNGEGSAHMRALTFENQQLKIELVHDIENIECKIKNLEKKIKTVKKKTRRNKKDTEALEAVV
jgi:hypothetical protein